MMALSFLTKAKTVLMVSDDALYIYRVDPKGTHFEEAVDWEEEGFVEHVVNIVGKRCGGNPVVILNDVVEQHYRKEKIPQAGLGTFDRSAVVKRRLAVAFPNYRTRAALPLKEKLKGDKAKSKLYLFTALPATEQLKLMMAFMHKSQVPISGMGLLPMESMDMVRLLAKKLTPSSGKMPQWVVFMGQHRSGGLRQIVVKNGELALTRMSPVTDDIGNPNAWAAEVYQEFQATMSYLSRFGYKIDDGLAVIGITDAACGEALRVSMESEEGHFYALDARDAAKYIGIPPCGVGEEHYADCLHVAWTARKNLLKLPLDIPFIRKAANLRYAAQASIAALVLAAGYFAYQVYIQGSAYLEQSQQYQSVASQKVQLDSQYQKLLTDAEALGVDIQLVQSALELSGKIESESFDTLRVFSAIGQALGRDLRLDRVILKPEEAPLQPRRYGGQAQEESPKFKLTMQMTYPSTTDIDKGNEEVRALREKLAALLPNCEVEVTKLLKDYAYVEEIVVEAGDVEKEEIQQDYVVELEITGPGMAKEEEQG